MPSPRTAYPSFLSDIVMIPSCLESFKFRFIELFFLCTFLSTVTEKYQKNTAKGLGALWTPVFPIWVCLTEDIHGGGSKSAPHELAETLFSRPAKLNPKQMRGHSCGCREFAPQGKVGYPSNALPAGRENGRVPRGRRSAVRAGYRVLATLRAINFFRLLAKEVRAVG